MNTEHNIYQLHKIVLLLPVLLSILLPMMCAYYESREYNAAGICLSVYVVILIYAITSAKIVSVSSTDIAVLAFSVYVLLDDYIRMRIAGSYLLEIGLLLTAYLVGRWWGSVQGGFRLFLYGMILSGTVQSVMAIFQCFGLLFYNHPAFPVIGSFFNPGMLGGYVCISLISAAGLLLYAPPRNFCLKLFLYVCILLTGIVCILSESRAACVAAFVALFFIITYKLRIRRLFKVAGFIVALSLLAVPVYMYKQKSADSRLLIWKVCSELICESPLTGHGADAVKRNYMPQLADYLSHSNGLTDKILAADNTYAFNEIVRIMCEYGLIGIILLCIILYTLTKGVRNEAWKIGSFLLLGYGIFSLFSYPRDCMPLLLWFPFLIGMLSDRKLYSIKVNVRLKVFFFLIIAVCAVISVRQWYYYRKLDTALVDYCWRGTHGDYLQNEYPCFAKRTDFVLKYAQILLMKEESKIAIPVLEQATRLCPTTEIYCKLGLLYQQAANWEQSEQRIRYAATMVPTYITPKFLLFRLYLQSEQKNKADSIAPEIIGMKVKIENKEVKRMKAEVQDYFNK
ncbi:O-antigen ligase family protein [Bacteroides sp. UBA939]|uniref:O-antigen ligase family protein n=1 Tax=Bacteroides sp. UBA939 TaxID=1946092 RepID=UPI0025C49452|nr:O-antigen ligase family protein [Bacteroides sp. UBA939]